MEPESLADQLRKVIRDSGVSIHGLARECELVQSTVHRFMAGGDMGLEAADKIARHYGVRFTRPRRR